MRVAGCILFVVVITQVRSVVSEVRSSTTVSSLQQLSVLNELSIAS